jgi:hypothetical protein
VARLGLDFDQQIGTAHVGLEVNLPPLPQGLVSSARTGARCSGGAHTPVR